MHASFPVGSSHYSHVQTPCGSGSSPVCEWCRSLHASAYRESEHIYDTFHSSAHTLCRHLAVLAVRVCPNGVGGYTPQHTRNRNFYDTFHSSAYCSHVVQMRCDSGRPPMSESTAPRCVASRPCCVCLTPSRAWRRWQGGGCPRATKFRSGRPLTARCAGSLSL